VNVIVFVVDDTRYAVELGRLLEVLPRVHVSRLAGAAAFVEGMFVHRGEACVAISLRRRFDCAPRRASLEDHFVVVRGRKRRLALVVDRVEGDRVVADEALTEPPTAARHVRGVLALADGIVLLQDLDALLTDEEERGLDASIEGTPAP
jgi:chemotaxis signal transduction protein